MKKHGTIKSLDLCFNIGIHLLSSMINGSFYGLDFISWNNSFLSWVSSCCFKSPLIVNLLEQLWHGKGFSLEWRFWCSLRFPFMLKDLKQILHSNGLSTVWELLECFFRYCFDMKALLHVYWKRVSCSHEQFENLHNVTVSYQ